jgi:hypothetical protein
MAPYTASGTFDPATHPWTNHFDVVVFPVVTAPDGHVFNEDIISAGIGVPYTP